MYCRHLPRMHPTVWQNYTQTRKTIDAGTSQSSMTDFATTLGTESSYGPRHPDQIRFASSLVADMTVGCGCSMSITEKPEFREFIRQLYPKLIIP